MTNEADTVKVKLLPCPFCGGEAKLAQNEGDDWRFWSIACQAASCPCLIQHRNPEVLVFSWNRRLAHEAEGKVEALDQPARLEQAVRAFEEVTGKLALPMTQKAIGAACVAYEHASPQAVRARVIEAGQLLSLAERLHYKGRIAPTVSEHDAYFEKASVLARAAEILADNSLKMPTREWMREKIAADPEEGIFNV